MKIIIVMISAIISSLVFGCSNVASTAHGQEYTNQGTIIVKEFKDDLFNIQKTIYQAFVQSLMSKSDEPLIKVSNQLNDLYKTKPNNLILYWKAYLHYYYAIYHIKNSNADKSEEAINLGVETLDKMSGKNSEDYALLALVQSFSIQFKSTMKIPFLSAKVKDNALLAKELAPSNLRAYYVYASSDFYTPEKYGGGKEAEEYLLKAISLPEQNIKNEYLPSWGKEESYEMLIKFYIRKNNLKQAKVIYKQGIEAYPESYTINQLASKLVSVE